MASLTREALPTSKRKTSRNTRSAISSPASASGRTPCALPDGPMTDLFGREVAPAQASARQEKARGLMTLVTSGLIGTGSCESENLQRSLENRLMTRLDTAGSTLFKLTWKGRTTPLGRRYLERAASARRTSGNGFSSLAVWNTPHASDNHSGQAKRVGNFKGKHCQRNCDLVMLAGWVSPTERDHSRGNLPPRETDTGVPLSQQAPLASWATPNATDGSKAPKTFAGGNPSFPEQAKMSGWGTPTAQPAQSSPEAFINRKKKAIQRGSAMGASVTDIAVQATLTVSGETRIGYSARDGIVTIGNGAQLNPAHSRWLQGLPAVFCDCAVTAMQSFRKSRRNSSKPT